LESRETLEYIGFDDTKAAEIWNQWQTSSDSARDSSVIGDHYLVHFIDNFINFALRGVHEGIDEEMTGVGMREDVKEAILDPEFDNVRGTASIAYWIKNALENKYLGWIGLQRESKERTKSYVADQLRN
jgi:hypothetical protein